MLTTMASGFSVGPSHLEKFYHHIFRTDTTIIAFINELARKIKATQ